MIALTDDFQLDEDILLSGPTGLPDYTWLQPTVQNKAVIGYDFNVEGVVANDVGRRLIYTANASVTRYGAEPPIEFEARGLRHDLNALAIADAWALTYFQRWGFQPWFLRCSTVYLKHLLEILDTVRVTHALIKNPITGTMGLDREQFEVIDVTPVFGPPQGRLNLLLMWTGAIETSAAPTRASAGLVPPDSFFNGTDVAVPEGGNVSVRTEANTRAFRLLLKRLMYRWWSREQRSAEPGPPNHDCSTPFLRWFGYNDTVYGSSVTYRVEYKLVSAPNVSGIGGDAATGWVDAPAAEWPNVRGNTAAFSDRTCSSTPTNPGVPGEDAWTLAFAGLQYAPNQYDVRVSWISTGVAADPGMGVDCFFPNLGTCPTVYNGASLQADVRTVTIDALESQFQEPAA